MYERVRQSPVTPYDGRSDRDRDVPVPDLSTYSKVVRACCGKFAVMTMVEGFTSATVRHVQKIDAGFYFQYLAHDVPKRPDARAAPAQLGRVPLQILHELRHVA